MFGLRRETKQEGALPIFVHSLQSAVAFDLAQKVWQVNIGIMRSDVANGKEFERFVFSNPECVAWLQRDIGRTDTFELILVWSKKDVGLTEVYSISAIANAALGDDTRARQLLEKMLVTPATVPVNQQSNQTEVQ